MEKQREGEGASGSDKPTRFFCFFDKERECPPTDDPGLRHVPACRAWNPDVEKCSILEYLSWTYSDGSTTLTTYPQGAPPPKVNS